MNRIWETIKEETLKHQDGIFVFTLLGAIYITIKEMLRK